MCLAVPGQIVDVGEAEPPFRVGRVDFGGLVKEINLSFVPDAKAGDYVITHVGVAIQTILPEEARRNLELLKEAEGR